MTIWTPGQSEDHNEVNKFYLNMVPLLGTFYWPSRTPWSKSIICVMERPTNNPLFAFVFRCKMCQIGWSVEWNGFLWPRHHLLMGHCQNRIRFQAISDFCSSFNRVCSYHYPIQSTSPSITASFTGCTPLTYLIFLTFGPTWTNEMILLMHGYIKNAPQLPLFMPFEPNPLIA